MSPQISIPSLESKLQTHLPSDLLTIYEPLFKDTIWLTAKWAEYCKLYGEGKETVDLINRHAGYFFMIVQDTLWDDVLLHITRLIASLKSRGKYNLTLRMLPGLIDDIGLRSRVNDLVNECVDSGQFATAHRNKRLAHTDKDLALASEPLLGSSRKQIKAFLGHVHAVLNAIYVHYTATDYHFSMDHIGDDARSLITSLRKAEASAL